MVATAPTRSLRKEATRRRLLRAALAIILLPALFAADSGSSAHAQTQRRAPLGTNLARIDEWSTEFPFLDVFKTYYGPMLKAFAALEPRAQAYLANDLIALIGQFNRSGDQMMVVPSDYLEIVIARR